MSDKRNPMKERPILFSGPMVLALLSGGKTQTRRVVDWAKIAKQTGCSKGRLAWSDAFDSWAVFNGDGEAHVALVECPHGRVGDHLWVREKWCPALPGTWDAPKIVSPGGTAAAYFAADWDRSPPSRWRPSIHMPRWASRITLEITSIRVERLQEISHKDALAEGVGYDVGKEGGWPLSRFKALWDSINGVGSWEQNPYVWVIAFKRIKP